MIIKRLSQTYRCGCERGQSEFKKSNLLTLLNGIIEWDWSNNWNKTSPPEELVPGDVIEFHSISGTQMICAIDSEDRLVQIISETGPLALKRVCEETVIPEVELLYQSLSSIMSTEIELMNSGSDFSIPVDYEEIMFPDYNKWKIVQDRLYPKNQGNIYKITFSHDLTLGMPCEILIDSRRIYYDPNEVINPECIPECWEDILGYLYQMRNRAPRPSIDWNDPDKVAEFLLNSGKLLARLSREDREKVIRQEGIEDPDLKDMILNYEYEEKEADPQQP